MITPQTLQTASTAVALVGLPVTLTSLYNTYGRVPVLTQKAKQLAELLDKLPDSAYGRRQIEDELRYRTFKLAHLYEFPNATRLQAQIYFMLVFTGAWIIGVWLENHYGRSTPYHLLVFIVITVTAHLAITEYFNGLDCVDLTYDVFQYLEGETGIYDPKPSIFLVRPQPTLQQIRERMSDWQEAAPDRQFDKVALVNTCWRELEEHLYLRSHWYEKIGITYLFVNVYRLAKSAVLYPVTKLRSGSQPVEDSVDLPANAEAKQPAQ
ncbi:hypothetical protein [Mycobacteroides abscessus]|uniref:hypothetical protein n=1 Tax=Mycobacteroides abscessus TaxID=36809 RepID=UPI000C25FDB7|nr:hypothetical protein [Mycobacteroides abscessus]